MKILAIDDQPLILKSLEQKFKNSDFEVIPSSSGEEALHLFDAHDPDIVIVDLQMPEMDGFEVIREIRNTRQSDTPIIVMSGDENESSILEAFDLGVNDYVKKPVGVNEIFIRVLHHLNLNSAVKNQYKTKVKNDANRIIQSKITGVVIPCYNEADRFSSRDFGDFSYHNMGYRLFLVNDGSTDNTLEVLKELENDYPDFITVVDMPANGGKAEAVRQGMFEMTKDPQIDYFGFLDADLSTDFYDFHELVETIDKTPYQIVSGSRMSRMGANITKQGGRAIISKTINQIIRNILGMSFNDTQCGAKVMTREVAENMFSKPFLTRWLFDVEIFLRMKKYYGKEFAKELIYEQPLKRWIHADGSKLSMKDSIKIMGQLGRLWTAYR